MSLPEFKPRRSMMRNAASAARGALNQQIATLRWFWRGRPVPAPPHIKRKLLLRFAKRHPHLKVFVETGTYFGDTLAFMRPQFDELHSIELSIEFHARAQGRFSGDTKICLWQGDSGEVMADVLEHVQQPIMFWLDGHYSGGDTARGIEDTPIYRELECLSQHPLRDQNQVVIDDARLFDGTNGYPSLEDLHAKARKLDFAQMTLVNDMIFLSA